jgi:UDP-3-O-[3-hydroxymyristoyl] glucosamine N-acyltransferase
VSERNGRLSVSLNDLIEVLKTHGISAQITGDCQTTISGVATLEEAGPGQISFLSNKKYQRHLATTNASAVVVDMDEETPDGLQVVRTPDPYYAITVIIVWFYGFRRHPGGGIDPSARVASSASIGADPNIMHHATVDDGVVIGDNATLYPGCYIASGCRIGNDVVLHPNTVLYEGTVLGDRVTIHAGTVIGNDGLGYAPQDGHWHKIPQIGHVEIGDDVEIGANCVIDRAGVGKTTIGAGTKFSNLIAIGHGARIGDRCLIVAQVGVAGSTTIGAHVTIAGQVGVVGHVTIGDNVKIGAQAGVVNNLEPNSTVLGAPAIPIAEKKRQLAALAKLPELRKQLQELSKDVEDLRGRLSQHES